MAPHGLPPIQEKTKVMAKPKTTVSMQIGVDILGFPIYRIHTIKNIVTGGKSSFHKTDSKEETVIEISTAKQH